MIPGSAISLLLATPGPTLNPRDFMDVALYTGNGSTQTISGLGFSPDLVWIKGRSLTSNNRLYDQIRGATKSIYSDLTDAEATESTGLTAFTSDGFSLGSQAGHNQNASTYVAWTWDAGSSTVTNTQGSISSQVRANASAGFSICTFSIASASATISTFGHGLGVAPSFVIFKVRTVADNWTVYHGSISSPTSNWLTLNSTAAAGGGTSTFSTSSTTFGVRETRLLASGTSGDIVAYCFAPVAGYSSFGSYTGNGSATGPVISGLGFQPYFVMIKASSTTGNWWMYDGARSPSNPRINKLKANTSGVEDTAGEDVDFQSDGFQIKTSDSGLNQNTATYIYAAFA